VYHAAFAWSISSDIPVQSYRERPSRTRRTRASRVAAVIAAVAALGALGATSAYAAPSSLAGARQAAQAAVAPLPVDGVKCFRQPGRARTFCVVNHPATAGGTCRSFVAIRKDGRARVFGSAQCTPSLLQEIEP
jgi:hypothetical protein